MRAIKDLCQRHRGEVRDISGEWTQIDRPFPQPVIGGNLYHTQFFHIAHVQVCLSSGLGRR